MPVEESCALNAELQDKTLGNIMINCTFHHWQNIDSDPIDPLSKAGILVQ